LSVQNLERLLLDVRSCTFCKEVLPLGPNPVLRANTKAKILIVGQAPGTKVHRTGIPWNDPSGDRLRQWMNLSRDQFYDEQQIAIIPMGFCYPGKGKSGDLPPRPECAELWHARLMAQLKNIQLTLCIGQYAQNHYIAGDYKTLTERVVDWQKFIPRYLPLPHPSPRNTFWLKRNSWFEEQVVPYLQQAVADILQEHRI